MTDVSDAVRDNAAAPDGEADDRPVRPPGPPPPIGGRGRPTALLAGLTALVAVVCGALLPFAPVSVSEPTVSWPLDPAHPESTLLSLTAYRPLTLDVRFTCDAGRAAQANGGVVVSTAAPEPPAPGTTGLIVTVRGDRVQIGALDRLLLDEPLPVGACEYRITGDSRGLPSFVRPASDPADPDAPDLASFAQPDNAELTISRDGTELVDTTALQLPDVDVLATDATDLPSGGLIVRMRVDDEFTSSPTRLKSVLIWTLVTAVLATALLLLRLDRMTPRVPHMWRVGWPRIVDVLVPAVIVFWMFVAPATDDDGYYAAIARNSVLSGDVGNYFQLYDQNFTPFTWFYQSLGWWQQLAGNAPVMQRIPAVVLGILTWLALRRFAVAAMDEWAPHDRGVRMTAHAALAVTFLSWWVPQNMGVRPETVVAVCGSATMLAVLAAGRRRRLGLAWLACALAGLGFTAHPTGFTLFAPLLAGLPLLLPVMRVAGDRAGTALRALAVASGGMVAPLLAFADAGLRDFLRGQAIVLSLQDQESWTTEIQRYAFLFSQSPMGNYAKRAVVLVCLVALVWFAVIAVAARAREVAVPTPLWLAGSTTALAFAALWLIPSKWTDLFGALAGVGPAFLALLLVMAVPLVRQVLQGAKLPIGALVAAAASFVVAIALGWHGPNQWAYAWLEGVHRPELPPAVKNIALDRPLLWVLVVVVAGLVGGAGARRARLIGRGDVRLGALRAVPVVVLISLVGTTVYTVGTFGAAAAQAAPRESIWAQGLADPTGAQCGAAGVVRVLDPSTASTLGIARGLPAPAAPIGFVPGAGFYEGDRPQGPAGDEVWGSLDFRNGRGANGEMTTGWYTLPSVLVDGAATTVLAAGTLTDGNRLTAIYGRSSGASVAPVGEEPLTDTDTEPSWRTFTLQPPAGADVVRLEAVDTTSMVDGWLAFSAPAVQRPVVLSEYLPAAAPVALAWPLAFAYPCQRQPTMVDGITEAPEYAVLWGDGPLSGFADGTWVPFRGGAFAHVRRTQSVQQLSVLRGVDPHIQVYAFRTPLARRAYTVTETTRTVFGASTGTGTGPATQR